MQKADLALPDLVLRVEEVPVVVLIAFTVWPSGQGHNEKVRQPRTEVDRGSTRDAVFGRWIINEKFCLHKAVVFRFCQLLVTKKVCRQSTGMSGVGPKKPTA